jgi:hypothetical protein
MSSDSAERTNAMLSIATALPRITRKTLGRRGLAEGSLVTDWATVVGPLIAERSLPLRLKFAGAERSDGTLHVRVSGALALELQHLEPQVLERINGYFGYRAVGRLRIHQGPVPAGRGAPQTPRNALAPQIDVEIGTLVSTVDDDDLRRALHELGRSLHRDGKG